MHFSVFVNKFIVVYINGLPFYLKQTYDELKNIPMSSIKNLSSYKSINNVQKVYLNLKILKIYRL